ncbi:hypothetical protein B0H10DRAFT_1938330 [Mycena sp. CBHHK59/15]|nr:hypothetical protein B0H10DRAFT_1938330 [Mycena sp. CBHHK59/15]
MAIPLLGVIGWTFIPRYATQQALNIVHYVCSSFLGIKPPLAGTIEYQRNYRYTFAVVVLGYLIYTLIEGSNSMAPNFYEILGVAPTVNENALKLAFRQFAKKNHPDRVGPQGEGLFILVRDAFEALKNPTVRFAYDRFGPDVLGWAHCSTPGEYLRHGLTQSAGYHLVAGAFLVFWTAIGETSPVAFWRYILYVTLFASEIALLLSPSPSTSSSSMLLSPFTHPADGPTHRTILHVIFPRRVAYQHILFLHQLFLFLSIALSRVAPQFFPDVSKVTESMTQRLVALIGAADREASQLLHTELHSIHPAQEHVSPGHLRPLTQPSTDIMDSLSEEMEKMIIEANVKQEGGPFKSAWQAAIEKGRWAAEAAASLPLTPMKGFNWGTLPRGGISPAASPLKGLFNGSPTKPPASPLLNGVAPTVNGDGRPNGRMSPPPPPTLDRSASYVRARSVSASY